MGGVQDRPPLEQRGNDDEFVPGRRVDYHSVGPKDRRIFHLRTCDVTHVTTYARLTSRMSQ
jgi:hypothetical protein